MEFVDLKRQYQRLQPGMEAAVSRALASGDYISGPAVAELEEALADYVGTRHCVAVANGTDALYLSLMACGIGPGDGVLTTPFTFFATAEVISLLGATPVFCDINPDTYNLDPFCLEQGIKRCGKSGVRPRAVIPVDLYGLPADYEALSRICRLYNLELVEDAAQALGASSHGVRAGRFGRFGCTSFFPSKPLGCYGDGGAIFTDSEGDAQLLRSLRVHGKGESKYDNRRLGLNSRLDTLQAVILLEKWKVFEEEMESRRQVAGWYGERLRDRVKTPRVPAGVLPAYALYTIGLPDQASRDGLQRHLAGQGIPSQIYYPTPLHRQPVYRELAQLPMPNAEQAAATVLSLPMHPYLTEAEVDAVCRAVLAYLDGCEEE